MQEEEQEIEEEDAIALQRTPEYEVVQSPVPVPEEEPEKNDMEDLFEVPQPEDNDMAVDHLVELDEDGEDDLADLVEVSDEDIMGPAPKAKPKYRIIPPNRRVVRRVPPPASLGGVQY